MIKNQIALKRLGDLIEANPKSNLKVRDSFNSGRFVFFTSGARTRYANHFLVDEENLYLSTGGMAHVHYYKGAAAYSTDCFSVRTTDELLTKYLYYFLLSKLDYINDSLFKGAALKHLQKRAFNEILVPLPSKSLQRQIVAMLDEAFESINTLVTNAENNLLNAKELFASYLNSAFTDNDEGWADTTLEMILTTQPRNGWSPPAAHHSGSGTPVLTLSSVTGFQFRLKKVKYTSAPTDLSRHYWVKNGDFLISRSNTPKLVGHVVIVSGISEPTIYPDLIMRMNIDDEKAITKFIYYQLRAPKLRSEITGRAQGANPTMKKLNKKAVQTLPMCLPSITTQRKIVSLLDALAEETQLLEVIYQQKINNLTELKQSTLKKAFAGEL